MSAPRAVRPSDASAHLETALDALVLAKGNLNGDGARHDRERVDALIADLEPMCAEHATDRFYE